MGTSIGHRLRDARLARGITLSHAAQRTGIREAHLRAVEQDALAARGVDRSRADGIIHAYARYLDVNVRGLLADRAAETDRASAQRIEPVYAHASANDRDRAVAGGGRRDGSFAPDDRGGSLDARDRAASAGTDDRDASLSHDTTADGVATGGRAEPVRRNGVGGGGGGPKLVRPGSNAVKPSSGINGLGGSRTTTENGRHPHGGADRSVDRKTAGRSGGGDRSAPLPFAIVGALVVGSILLGAVIGVMRWRGAEQTPIRTQAVAAAAGAADDGEAVAPADGDASTASGAQDSDSGDAAGAGSGDAAAQDPTRDDAAGAGGGDASGNAQDDSAAAQDANDSTLLDIPQSTAPPDELTMKLEFTDEVWVRVVVDGENQLEGIMRPGAVTQFTGDRRIQLRVGVADAVEYSFNGAWYGNISSGYDKPVDVTCTLKSSCKVTKVG